MIDRQRANTSRSPRLSRTLHVVVLLSATLGGCHPRVDGHAPPSGAPADLSQSSYLTPPVVTSAIRMEDGGVALGGKTDSEARVRLQSPDGSAYGVTAGADGSWTLATPLAQGVRLLGVAEVIGSRAVQSVGYLAVLPAPGQAAILLRAGAGSQTLAAATASPWISAIDFDADGGAVISGTGRPGVPVRVAVDGVAAGEGRPDASGRFSVMPSFTLKSGLHRADAQSSVGQGHASFAVTPAAPIAGAPFAGQRQAEDWRIDWLTPAGAPQTTLVFDRPDAGGHQP